MASVVEANAFSEDLGKAVHNLTTGVIKAYFSNTAITAAMANKAAYPTEVSNGNGYTTGGLTATCTYTLSTGTSTLALSANLVLTATGAVGPFRYVGFYNDTAASDQAICFFDHGSSITMANTDTYTVPSGTLLTVN